MFSSSLISSSELGDSSLTTMIDEQISRRWKPTAEEMAVLGEMFVRCPMPTVSMIAELGLRFGLPPRQVRPRVRVALPDLAPPPPPPPRTRPCRSLTRPRRPPLCPPRAHAQVRVWFQNRRQRTRNSVRGKHGGGYVRPASAGYRRIMSTSAPVDAGSDWSGGFERPPARAENAVLVVDTTAIAHNERAAGQLAVDFVDEFIDSADEMACAAAWDISSALAFESSRNLTSWLM
jgi:hypothetical protein